MKAVIDNLNNEFQNRSTQEVIVHLLDQYKEKVGFSSSFGAEDQVLSHMILSHNNQANIFTLDTGRLPYETYAVMDSTNLKYNTKVNVFFPNHALVETLYQDQGINGFYESIQQRKACCFTRKLEPLKRALKPLDVWITGLRATQSVTRTHMNLFEWDENHSVIKANPLINWSEEAIWDYIKQHNIPYNKLHDKGYPSIGCAPCTRAIKEGEDLRGGRWWWENPEHKECGLHQS